MFQLEAMAALRARETQQMAQQCAYSQAVARLRGPGLVRRTIALLGKCLVMLGGRMVDAGRSRDAAAVPPFHGRISVVR